MDKSRFQKIYIEITNCCNLKCSFCPDGNRTKEFMSIIKFEEIINKIKNYTNLVALHVKGEPLLHPNLKEILDMCEQNNMQVNITTNGTLILENEEVLYNSNALRQLNISLHSISQNENMNSKTYMENIFEVVRKLKNPYISYRLWNLENIKENGENIELLNLLQNEYNYNDLVIKAKENSFVKLGEKVFLNQDIEFRWPDISREVIAENGTCLGLRNQIAVLVNGDVVPCCLDQNGDIKLGNIFSQELDSIISSKYSKEFIKSFEENRIIHNLCKRCGFRMKFDS